MPELDTSSATNLTSHHWAQPLFASLVDPKDEDHSNASLPGSANTAVGETSHLSYSSRPHKRMQGLKRRTRHTGLGCASCRDSKKNCTTTQGASRPPEKMGWCDLCVSRSQNPRNKKRAEVCCSFSQAGVRTTQARDMSNTSRPDQVDVPWWPEPVECRSGGCHDGMIAGDERDTKTTIGGRPSQAVARIEALKWIETPKWNGDSGPSTGNDSVNGVVKDEPAASSDCATYPPIADWDTWQNDGGHQYDSQADAGQPPLQINGYLDFSQAQTRASMRTSRVPEWWTNPLDHQNAVFRSTNLRPGMNTQCHETFSPLSAYSSDAGSPVCPIYNQYHASLFAEDIPFGTDDAISLGLLGFDQFPLNTLDDCSGSFGPESFMVPGAFMVATKFNNAFEQIHSEPGCSTDFIGAEWAAMSLAGGYVHR